MPHVTQLLEAIQMGKKPALGYQLSIEHTQPRPRAKSLDLAARLAAARATAFPKAKPAESVIVSV